MRMEYVELLLEALNKPHKCEICGKEGGYLELFHIKPISEGGLNKLSNVKLVCQDCGKNSHGLQFERGNKASYIKAYMQWYFKTHPEQYQKHLKRYRKQ